MEEKYWIWISRIKGIGNRIITNLIEMYGNLENVWNLDKKQLMNCSGISEITANKILNTKYREGLERYIKYMKENQIELITIYDKRYPKRLKQIYDFPMYLYVKGNVNILNDYGIAIVGSRLCSRYGAMVSEKFASRLTENNINIISGLAKGIDTYAHIGCVKAGGKTIAVLGNGLDMIYPKENIEIANKIIKNGGALVSEYVIGSKPEKLNFPARNRIVSGMSCGVLVVEAGQRSGALITVDFALEQGKEVFVIPRQYKFKQLCRN